jgi:hypothetical protein
MQYYNYRVDRKVYRCNMFKDTCLIAHKIIDQSPHILDLESLGTAVAPEQDHLIMRTHNHSINQNATNMYYAYMN